ncbi:hypothetical protein TNIN_187791 [Trichonephila inaurata madagascariensis]|uniref:Uncharacterized protein n=1 Tax=Trichonephila inaurata madagascariensis TaxID=2747483 RepID=A0A8X6XI30_9ARAC|nr:hypothetical protein TNIN_187791 [Trichonephila inaurata madagascariensis]
MQCKHSLKKHDYTPSLPPTNGMFLSGEEYKEGKPLTEFHQGVESEYRGDVLGYGIRKRVTASSGMRDLEGSGVGRRECVRSVPLISLSLFPSPSFSFCGTGSRGEWFGGGDRSRARD